MKSNLFCPVSDQKINERVARMNAIYTVLLLLIFGVTQNIFVLLFLASDFLLRALRKTQYSPLAYISKRTIQLFDINQKLINAGPKIFAARVGLFLTALLGVFFLFELYTAAIVIAGILLLFSTLEGIFGICVACIVYPYLYRFIYQ